MTKRPLQVLVLLPTHVGLSQRLLMVVNKHTYQHCTFLRVYKDGVAWRGLFPGLLQARRPISRLMVRCILENAKGRLQNSKGRDRVGWIQEKSGNNLSEFLKENQGLIHRRKLKVSADVDASISTPFVLVILPPFCSSIDVTFSRAIVRLEHVFLQLQSLTALIATLGGGYFFCRRLTTSLGLARTQRHLARILGHSDMVRSCTINEAYNLIFLGRFRQARRVLKQLFWECEGKDDAVVVRKQCQAGWILSKRLEGMAGSLEEYHHYHPAHPLYQPSHSHKGALEARGSPVDQNVATDTVDDFQRIRIVSE